MIIFQASALVSDGIRGAIEDYYNDPDIHFAIDTLQQEVSDLVYVASSTGNLTKAAILKCS